MEETRQKIITHPQMHYCLFLHSKTSHDLKNQKRQEELALLFN